jgi:hypothetical protein
MTFLSEALSIGRHNVTLLCINTYQDQRFRSANCGGHKAELDKAALWLDRVSGERARAFATAGTRVAGQCLHFGVPAVRGENGTPRRQMADWTHGQELTLD